MILEELLKKVCSSCKTQNCGCHKLRLNCTNLCTKCESKGCQNFELEQEILLDCGELENDLHISYDFISCVYEKNAETEQKDQDEDKEEEAEKRRKRGRRRRTKRRGRREKRTRKKR